MKRNKLIIAVFVLMITSAVTYIIWNGVYDDAALAASRDSSDRSPADDIEFNDYRLIDIRSEEDAREVISIYAERHDIDEDEYPDYMVERLVSNPELRDFVLEYPQHADEEVRLSSISIEEDIENAEGVPEFYQWDKRWGYRTYGSDVMGFTGCGPTCLSMVAVYLLDNDYMTPAWVAQFSMDNGYYDYENYSGTFWSLMTSGAETLGLIPEEVTGEVWDIEEHLANGEPIIAIMGPGDFTSEGHFIVLVSCEDGYLRVIDPNSRERTARLWDIDEVLPQIQGMWAYSV
ncbi:MAG: C39 family peptidase [Saccharofermentans sp.]|nr:C39 family peptidase [Saccharofermentans sp.]